MLDLKSLYLVLGNISQPTEDKIIKIINKRNPKINLNLNDVSIDINNKTITAKTNSKKVKGSASFNATFRTSLDIYNNKLEFIENITLQNVVDKFNQINLTNFEVGKDISNLNIKNKILYASRNSDKIIGSIKLEWCVIKDLSCFNNNLGFLEKYDDITLLNVFNRLNKSDIKISEVSIL